MTSRNHTGVAIPPCQRFGANGSHQTALTCDDKGSLIVPDAPGIGVGLAPDAAERHRYKMRWLGTRLYDDSSVKDQ